MSEPTSNDPTPPRGPRPPVSPAQASAPTPPPPPAGYAPAAYGPPPKARGSAFGKLLASVVGTLLLISILVNVYLGLFVATLTGGPSKAFYAQGDAGQKAVSIVPISGTITSGTAEYVRQAMNALDEDPPDAVVLRIESGGGGVGASDQIWSHIQHFRKDHPEVKMLASFGTVAASGGYYISTPADFVMAENTTITGSIGVLAEVPTFEDALDKLGVKVNVYVADNSPNKETANNMFRTWDKDDKAVVKALLNNAYSRFVHVVYEGRKKQFKNEQAVIDQVATGRIYNAQDAKKAGLIDSVGYLDDALVKANEMAGGDAGKMPGVTIVRPARGFGLASLLGASTHLSLDDVSVTDVDLDPDRVRAWITELKRPIFAYQTDFR